MAQDRAAERGLARHFWQAGCFSEGGNPYDRIMTPKIPFILGPPRHAAAEDGAVERGGELLATRQQGAPAHELRNGLDQGGVRRALHLLNKMHNRVALHVAVGIEHDHVVVPPAPAHDEVANIAGLAMMIDRAAAIADRHIVPDRLQ